MSRSDEQRIADIQHAITTIDQYRPHLDAADPTIEHMAADAILRNLAVIGEAARALSDDYKAQRTVIPWRSIIGLRNVVIHEYFAIRTALIRDIVDNELGELRRATKN